MRKIRYGEMEASIDDLISTALGLANENIDRKQKCVIRIENPTKFEDTWRFVKETKKKEESI